MAAVSPPRRRLVLIALGLATAFAALYAAYCLPPILSDTTSPAARLVLLCKLLVECVFAYPAATTIALAAAYLFGGHVDGTKAPAREPESPGRPIGLVYLCCGDLDADAVDSLLRLRYEGPLHLVVHDDTPGGDPRVDILARELANHPRIRFTLLRRPERTGGKPGALNYVLDQVGTQFEHFLLCDNDSVALDRDCIAKMLVPMRDPQVAAVQCRNVAVEDASYCTINRVLSRAIDVFHLFLWSASRFAWTPFVGHNALLRTESVLRAGGFTPGLFADDIDLTVRFNLQGQRVCYLGDVPFGEKHPPSYAAFRKRTRKWAYGSMQVLRDHLGSVLRTPHLNLAEKWGFLHFIGFFTLQTVLLCYVAMLFLIAPMVLDTSTFDIDAAIVSGSIIPFLIFLPVTVYALKHRRLDELPGLVATCWLGYGATDFPTAAGTLEGLRRGEREWVPTNSVKSNGIDPQLFVEALFGIALLLIPLTFLPEMLLSPLTFVVATKFLFIPTMAVIYRDDLANQPRPIGKPLATASALGALGLGILSMGASVPQDPAPSTGVRMPLVRVEGDKLFSGDAEFVVRGVHYGPWRPKTGPGRSEYPSNAELSSDLDLCVELQANAILTFDPPRRLLDLAAERGIRVLYAFWIEWPGFATDGFAERHAEIVATAEGLGDHPAVLGWVLGNEIPTWVIDQRSAAGVSAALHALYKDVKAADPRHLVTHANWPNARGLDLGFLDVCAFNLYALWPPEVVARGYGNFVGEVLKPIAANRPLLISEYGTNSLEASEAGQARLVAECWQGLRGNGAVGGFAFELADEWWKNYSNPKLEGAWWDRFDDLEDHLVHDKDPEEHYGLVHADRTTRKPAFTAVRDLYSGRTPTLPPDTEAPGFSLRGSYALLVGSLLVLAATSLAWSIRRKRPGTTPATR